MTQIKGDPKNPMVLVEKTMTAPKDDYNLAYIIHLLMGISYLMPWNVFITAVDYFTYLYPDKHIDKAFAVAYMVSSLLVLLALIGTSGWSRRPSVQSRINAGLAVFILCLSVAPLMDLVAAHHHGRRTRGGYAVIISTVTVCGLADGLVGGSLVGSTAALPKRYMQAVFAGTAASGVLATILRIITKASLAQNPKGLRTSTHFYFIVSIAIILGCIVGHNILDKLPIIKYYRHRRPPPSQQNPISSKDTEKALPTSHFSSTEGHPKFWVIWKSIKWPACGVCVIYIVTLSIFPGYITEDVHSQLLKDWYPILLITTYNISDLLGKSMTAAYVPKGTKKVIWVCFARFIFYPLFAACLHGPKLFRTEIPVIFLTFALGLTNGYLTSVLMILTPKSVPSVESETAGTVTLLFLGIGLSVGPAIGWFWVI